MKFDLVSSLHLPGSLYINGRSFTVGSYFFIDKHLSLGMEGPQNGSLFPTPKIFLYLLLSVHFIRQLKEHSLHISCLLDSISLFKIPFHVHISHPTGYLFLLSSWHLMNASRYTIPHNNLSHLDYSCLLYT